ncbi:copper resistance CopC family protein [Caballeronia concitans]|uniref:Copper resistance protein CopC n=1 Tax=Caballeronia concitans TaxID=1777133 RepID=A0A658R3M6_9BURK|nr:copper resistance protein CopC [Caballeronia concitans]KIG01764.1 copper resistance protein CopC [Burkholderia sp. MR1]SAL47238.1 copper resistance protein CopC [Caballeronia concitans]
MNSRHIPGRRVARAACALGLVWSVAASAHVFPRTQVPAAGATVSPPGEVRINFDGPLEPAFSSLVVDDATGKQVNIAKSGVDAQHQEVMAVALPPLQPGHYTVHWVAVASDGHRTHGNYGFDVK